MPATAFSDLHVSGLRAARAAGLAAARGEAAAATLRYAEAAGLQERAAEGLAEGPLRRRLILDAAWLWLRAERSWEVARLAAALEGSALSASERSRLREILLRAFPRPDGPLH